MNIYIYRNNSNQEKYERKRSVDNIDFFGI